MCITKWNICLFHWHYNRSIWNKLVDSDESADKKIVCRLKSTKEYVCLKVLCYFCIWHFFFSWLSHDFNTSQMLDIITVITMSILALKYWQSLKKNEKRNDKRRVELQQLKHVYEHIRIDIPFNLIFIENAKKKRLMHRF